MHAHTHTHVHNPAAHGGFLISNSGDERCEICPQRRRIFALCWHVCVSTRGALLSMWDVWQRVTFLFFFFYSHKGKGSWSTTWSCERFSESSGKKGLANRIVTKTCVIVVWLEKTKTKTGLLGFAHSGQIWANIVTSFGPFANGFFFTVRGIYPNACVLLGPSLRYSKTCWIHMKSFTVLKEDFSIKINGYFVHDFLVHYVFEFDTPGGTVAAGRFSRCYVRIFTS